MKLPVHLENANEWLLVGPMGPEVRDDLAVLPTIAVDGGRHHCQHFDLWLGDGDSGEPPILSANVWTFPQDKNSSDLSLSLNMFGSKKGLRLHFWGFLGGRRDHEWINIGETLIFLEKSQGSSISFYNNQGEVEVYCLGKGEWNFHHKGVFSLSTHKATQIKITGECKYTLSNWTELSALSSFGLSNTAFGSFQISCEAPSILFMVREKK